MKLSKKAAMVISFAVGTIMFSTAAIAEVASKSGYDQLKDALKFTSASCAHKLSNYTINTSYVIKDNDNAIYSQDKVEKDDVSKGAMEHTTVTKIGDDKSTNEYYYRDKSRIINYNSDVGDVYNEQDFLYGETPTVFSDPFEDEYEADFEKIADAVVGNLKDYVVVTQNDDGSKVLSVSLNETQIPSIMNALASLEIKSEFNKSYYSTRTKDIIPMIKSDVTIKLAKGNITVGKDGLIQSISATGKLSAKDANGVEHKLSIDILFKLTDINSTIVNKPDLTGKKVNKFTDLNDVSNTSSINMKKFIGKYRNDIVITKDNSFVKIGERFLEITSIDGSTVYGKYHEEYKKGYENYGQNSNSFSFVSNTTTTANYCNGDFDFKASTGHYEKGTISFSDISSIVTFSIDFKSKHDVENYFDFYRVFD